MPLSTAVFLPSPFFIQASSSWRMLPLGSAFLPFGPLFKHINALIKISLPFCWVPCVCSASGQEKSKLGPFSQLLLNMNWSTTIVYPCFKSQVCPCFVRFCNCCKESAVIKKWLFTHVHYNSYYKCERNAGWPRFKLKVFFSLKKVWQENLGRSTLWPHRVLLGSAVCILEFPVNSTRESLGCLSPVTA